MLRVQKWGNSAAVRLNAEMIRQLGVKIGDTLEAEICDTGLVMRPVKQRRYRLADLLAEMPQQPPRAEGWDEMPAVGGESD